MKVVIVDDHPLVRKGLVSILTLNETMEVLGEAKNSREAMDLFSSVKPDLALVDLRLGNESGLDLISKAMKQGSTCKFVVLTSSTEERDFIRAKEVGVDGYVLKEAFPEELIHALRIISKGRKYYDPGVLDLVMRSSESIDGDKHIEQLTPKEKEVLIVLGKGHSNKEISQILFITEYTVKKHVSQILAKLGLTDRTQAALYANAKGLVTYRVH
ncbi:response regulator transcription factor [Neobacillus drentensis]|uniref:response regulator transcription factor n=1 Tax=Neobacillus drentensis TaxID=220684 RepID=UPI0028558B1C|nr:response regulator transcription factor [Neobacillus drentensis]MDR7239074.1 DNA-binding NarL/FixJ family response regulator [Neobacillus drentensis]